MKHFARSILVALTLFAGPVLANPSSPPPASADTHETLSLRKGGSKVVQAPGMNRVAVGDPEIAEITFPEDAVIHVTGLKAGETTLVVWIGTTIKTYRIVVQG
ncbi:pilus assembly protein N-terminal domain-containing protein [Hyalangium rubrum]|uniref:Pilus assembly protein N-terminal domain-containing protein n=1 Tax=Hyalangium rubrum TaxID=3103134 RepID=A0ABU5HF89_9BACT|nr:pilus assembly protein N-terminal domain-containing protein [Hyalangium sp. s54d21]MDY7232142.1 pilus assembly protein N-terminal domain-containing protein [Hyalangium sp. s54d21]